MSCLPGHILLVYAAVSPAVLLVNARRCPGFPIRAVLDDRGQPASPAAAGSHWSALRHRAAGGERRGSRGPGMLWGVRGGQTKSRNQEAYINAGKMQTAAVLTGCF